VADVFDPIVLSARNPGPMTGDGNNTYLIASNGSLALAVLIDAGVGEPVHLDELAAALADRGASLDAVLVTHGHTDHASGAPPLAARYPHARFLKQPWPAYDARYDVRWERLADGDVVDAAGEPLVVVATPGHSPDHLAFWHAASRTMFTGDLVVVGSSVMIHASRGGNLTDYMRSLERVQSFDPAVLLPAHGVPATNPAALLTAYLNHRREREQQVLSALRARHDTVEAITESIYHGLSAALLPAARENVRAHLEKLRSDGLASCDGDRWRL